MKKKLAMISMMAILLLSTVSAFTKIGLAAEVAMNGNGVNDAIITDANGHEIDHQENLSKYGSYQVTYHWHIPDGTKIKEGDTATFTLPNNVIPRDNIGFNIVYQDQVVGTYYQAADSQTGTLTFNDYFQKHPKTNIHGTLTIEVTGKEENEADNNDWMINKVGWFDDQNVPTWNVAMNPNNKHYDHLTVSDTMSSNQELIPGSVIIQYGHYDNKGTFIVERQDNHPDFEQNGQTLTFNLTNMNSVFQIVYKVKPTIKDGTLTNSATVSGPNLSAVSSSAWLSYGGSGNAAGDGVSGTSQPMTTGSTPVTTPTSSHEQQPIKPSSTSSSTGSSSSSEVVKPSSTSSSTGSSSSSEVVKPSSTSSSTESSSSSEVVKPSSTSSSTGSSSSEEVNPSSTSSSTGSSSSEEVNPSSMSSSTETEVTTSQSAAIKPIVPSRPSQTTSSTSMTQYGTGANGVNNGHSTSQTMTAKTRTTTAIQPHNHSEKGYDKENGGHGKVTRCDDAKVLPQTGTQPPYLLMGVGSVIIVGVAFWYVTSRKQHQ